jgi:pimeloyl-ACP methyl ester carboxylesterase
MEESVYKIDGEYIFVRHNSFHKNRMTLLFLHGLGESGLCFKEVFEDERFQTVNLIIPDLIGYGKSTASVSSDYSFHSHIQRIKKLLVIKNIQECSVIGHSLGGDIGTLLCASDKSGIVKKFVNIEGDLTQHDVFISNLAVEADKKGRFKKWWEYDFLKNIVYDGWGQKYDSCRRYFASLCFCNPQAFLDNAKELVNRNTALTEKNKSEIGKTYLSLNIPKVYCCGTESLSPDTMEFIKENNIDYLSFKDAFHWLMIDRSERFYSFLFEYVCH